MSRLEDVVVLATWLDPELMRGRKGAELEVWLRAVDERRSARAAGTRVPGERMDELIAEFRAARAYRPGSLRRVGPQPKHDTTVAVLRAWAETEPGVLTCTRYAAAREPDWPSRNTITRRFGSWDAAVRAAGLADRLARPEPRPVGGAAAREARTAAQRERVLATLR